MYKTLQDSKLIGRNHAFSRMCSNSLRYVVGRVALGQIFLQMVLFGIPYVVDFVHYSTLNVKN